MCSRSRFGKLETEGMDGGPTLDVIDGLYDEEEDEDGEETEGREREVWGRLFPLTDAYSKMGKVVDDYLLWP